jgi:hypothetical protein
MKIPKQVVEKKEEKKLFEENKNLKFTILRMLHQIQLYESKEIEREKDLNVLLINIEILFANVM